MGNAFRFRGQYEHSVDHKGRVSIPYTFRRALAPEEKGLVLTKGFDGEIEVHPLSEWEGFENGTLLSLPTYRRAARRFRVRRSASACEVALDSQGRVMLPKKLMEYARIDKEVIIVGNVDYCQIWNPTRFAAFEREAEENQEADSENLPNLLSDRGPQKTEGGDETL